MKKLFLVFLALYPSLVFSYELELSQYDQEKLAELVERLPAHIRKRDVIELSVPLAGKKILSEFPTGNLGFKILCESNYFNNASYASSAFCRVHIDDLHPEIEMGYEEFKIMIYDSSISYALFQAISYGRPAKEFRSEKRKQGISFDGELKTIFGYYFKCFPDKCVFKFLNDI
jgi:hypothetical protein